MKNDIYFNFNKLLTYNEPLLYFVLGERGVGKSYGAKIQAIKHFLKTGKQFIYLRRYHTEIKKVIKENEFLKDIINDNSIRNIKFDIKNENLYINDKLAAYFIPLSKQLIYKSVPFPNVDYIIFDEFLIAKGTYHYLPDEPIQLLEFIESVGRLRDIKCFLLGNALSIINPYFDYFNISLPYNKDVKLFNNNLILVNYIKNEKYREKKKQSKIGKLINNTNYGNYAIDNKFLLDNNRFIRKKDRNSKFIFNLFINNNKYGIWLNKNNEMFISTKYDDNCPINITFNFKDHSEHTILLKTKSVWFKNIVRHYENSLLFFENQNIKNYVLEILKKTY